MKTAIRATIGATIVLILVYFAGAFIQADLWWLRDVMSWTRDSRTVLLFMVACVTMMGAVFAA